MNRRLLSVVCLTLSAACAGAQQGAPASRATPAVAQAAVAVPASDELVARMIDEGTHRSHVAADLEYLLDVIGPRLTGSAAVQRANAWTRDKFREYGADSVALDPWKFGAGWTRGPMTLRMLAPQARELLGVSWAWSPGTNGPVAGDVVLMDARTPQEFDKRFAGKLRGKWVLLGTAQPVVNAADPLLTHEDSARQDSIVRALGPHNQTEQQFFAQRFWYVAREGVAGIVRDGGKQFGLFAMSGSPIAISPVPQVVVANDVYAQMQRLAQRAVPVRIEADIHNSFTRDSLQQYNTVAEIRGTEHPEEFVLLGAHLDSWDLATGGTDNGAGAIAVLEAARILEAAGVRPKRTIKFVLFTGEEEGLLGSQAYAAEHAGEADRCQAVLVLDNGTGRITGMALQGREELRDMWKAMLAPLSSLGQLTVRSGFKTGTDHLSFIQDGVPSFNYDQLTRGYDHTHHSQIDDFDHVVPRDVAQAATIMAVNAWQLADMAALLPRGKKG
jgi:hypothetical protein